MIGFVLAALLACPPTGDATQARARDLDLLKNRDTTPGTFVPLDIANLLAPGNDVDRFDPRVGVKLTAYLVAVGIGGIESANCHATDAASRDIHLSLGATPTAAPRDRVIVEVTPRWKAALGGPTVMSLRAYVGQRITVYGWPLFDIEHANASEHTHPAGVHNWRATAWEIHPIVQWDLP